METVNADQRGPLLQSERIPSFERDRHELSDISRLNDMADSLQETPSRSIWILAFAAGVSGLLFGYE